MPTAVKAKGPQIRRLQVWWSVAAYGKITRRAVRVGICEDSVPDADLLKEYVSGWGAEVNRGNRLGGAHLAGIELRVSVFPDAEEFHFRYPDDPRFHILLLDIHMGAMDGFSLAQKIRQKDRKVALVFITGDPYFADKGYDVGAIGYLVKPVRRERLYAAMDKCLAAMLQHDRAVLIWEVQGELRRIYQEDILYFESDGHMITAVTPEGSLQRRMSWAELESSIFPGMFAQTHKSYAVGLGHVDLLGKTQVTLDNGTVLPVSRRLEKRLRAKFIEFHGGTRNGSIGALDDGGGLPR